MTGEARPGDSMIDRRTMLRGLFAAGALAAAPGRLWATAAPRRVVVVGAGLAGLAAALELRQGGVEALVLESAGYAGGRIRTLRDFADGLTAEAGGDAIGGTYRTVLGLVREFGLSVVPSEGAAAGREADFLLDLNGERQRLGGLRRDPSGWPVDLSEEERPKAPFGLLFHYLGPLAREMGRPEALFEPRWLAYDQMSLEDLLRRQGASPAALRMIEVPLNYNRLDSVSALSVLRDLARRMASTSVFRIAGGNDALPLAMAARLGSQVHYGSRLRRIEREEPHLKLAVERHGRTSEVLADAVIVTLPFTALRRVEIEPALPEPWRTAVAELPYTQVTKTYVQARRRFWRDELGLAAVWSDGPFERLFDLTGAPEGDRGLLLSWINGEGALRASAETPEVHERKVLDYVAGVFPEHADLLERAVAVPWGQTYCRGAYAHFAPGQVAQFGAQLGEPVGNLFFAGEHTEPVAPGMEGALVSGQRAARQVLTS